MFVNYKNVDLESNLKGLWKVEDIKKVVRRFNLDLQQEPAYSNMILNHMLSRFPHHRQSLIDEVIAFLDDPSLNTPGSGNYLSLLEHLVLTQTNLAGQTEYLRAIFQAIKLGLVSNEEIRLIIRTLPELKMDTESSESLRTADPGVLARYYRRLWYAIEGCSVLNFKDLGEETMNTWLCEILAAPPKKGLLLLAKKIVKATYDSDSQGCPWIPDLILQWMSLEKDSRDGIDFSMAKFNAGYVSELLRTFNPNLASKYLVRVTEILASLEVDDLSRPLALEAWQDCLYNMPEDFVSFIISSELLFDTKPLDRKFSHGGLPNGATSRLEKHHRVLLRIWTLRCLSRPFAKIRLKEQTYPAIFRLFGSYNAITRKFHSGHANFVTNLTNGLQDLKLPYNNVLMLGIGIYTRRRVCARARPLFRELETGKTSLSDIFADLDTFSLTWVHFFPSFSRKVRKTDVTTKSFIHSAIRIVKYSAPDSLALLRILRLHVPLQIALAKSWIKLDPAAMALVPYNYYSSLASYFPDPRACLELINCLAVALACSKALTPGQSFRRVKWLYHFLCRYNAPVEPTFVRALYHCGVVRYRQAGIGVTPARRRYIMGIVKKVEGPEAVRALMEQDFSPGAIPAAGRNGDAGREYNGRVRVGRRRGGGGGGRRGRR